MKVQTIEGRNVNNNNNNNTNKKEGQWEGKRCENWTRELYETSWYGYG